LQVEKHTTVRSLWLVRGWSKFNKKVSEIETLPCQFSKPSVLAETDKKGVEITQHDQPWLWASIINQMWVLHRV
jgi:hypothetical protein